MDLKQASGLARQHLNDLFAPALLENVRLEAFLYDDHLMVWSLTFAFALHNSPAPDAADAAPVRQVKIVRVSEPNKSVLSVQDR